MRKITLNLEHPKKHEFIGLTKLRNSLTLIRIDELGWREIENGLSGYHNQDELIC